MKGIFEIILQCLIAIIYYWLVYSCINLKQDNRTTKFDKLIILSKCCVALILLAARFMLGNYYCLVEFVHVLLAMIAINSKIDVIKRMMLLDSIICALSLVAGLKLYYQCDKLILLNATVHLFIMLMTLVLYYTLSYIKVVWSQPTELKKTRWNGYELVSIYIIALIIIENIIFPEFFTDLLDNDTTASSITSENFEIIVIVFILGISIDVMLFAYSLLYNRLESFYSKSSSDVNYINNEYGSKVVKDMYEEARKIRHNISNDLLTIRGCIEQNDNDTAIEYIDSLRKKKEEVLSYTTYCDNRIINYLLNYKASVCMDKKIDIQYDILVMPTNMSDVDLNILIGNLLDNAIEAASQIEDNNRRISFNLEEHVDYYKFMISNSILYSVLTYNPAMQTTKEEIAYHGYGLKSIIGVVEKYNGNIEYTEKDDTIICSVYIKKDIN